jgi:phosphotriesterase-related protein
MGTSEVMTVRGLVPVSELGVTLPHEHLLIDLSAYVDELARLHPSETIDDEITLGSLDAIRRNPYGNRTNCLLDSRDLAIRELQFFKEAGGRTVVDATNPDIGSDPEALRAISEATDIHIVAGCGHYIHFAHPPNFSERTVDELAESLVDEIENGLMGTSVRPGMIGEIGTTSPMHPDEEKMLRAAARAHLRTGLTISVHVHPPKRSAHEALDVLEEEGVALNRVVLDHVDSALAHSDIGFEDAVSYHRSLAIRGAWVEFDLCGNSGFFTDGTNSWWLPSDRERCMAIAQLVHDGHAGSLLISQDVGHKHYLREYGGWGYAHVLTTFKDMLESFGVDAATHERITVKNPANMLTGAREGTSAKAPATAAA